MTYTRRSEPDKPGRMSAWRITLTYAAFSAAWIVLSDRAVALLAMPQLHTYKGMVFIAISAGALYVYLRRKIARQETAERNLASASESKGRLVSAIGHDLRQPLQSLTLFADVVQCDPNLSPRSTEALQRLGQSVEHMGALLHAILDLARLDGGQVVCERRPVALNELFSDVAEELRPQAEEKGLRLKWVPTAAMVESDPMLLRTILRNLAANAVRYTERGAVLIGCRRSQGRRLACVYDTGSGIEADKLGLVFEEFYQIGNPARDHRLGLGLGLAIVERLTRALGHGLQVRSRPGRGSAFCVAMPSAPSAGLSAGACAPSPPRCAPPVRRGAGNAPAGS